MYNNCFFILKNINHVKCLPTLFLSLNRTNIKKMRKFILTPVFIACMMIVSCDNEKIITAEQLPAPARAYIQKAYPTATIMFAKEDTEWFETKYKIQLDNRVELEFNSDGAPIDVDME